MSEDGGAAFACAAENGYQEGMSLRDYFAGQALMGLTSGAPPDDQYITARAQAAYRYADAMIKVRNRDDG